MKHRVKLNKEISRGIGIDWNIEYDIDDEYYKYYFYPDNFCKLDWLVVHAPIYIPINGIIEYLLDLSTEDRSISGKFFNIC